MENEHLVQDIVQAASANHSSLKKILRTCNFYDERIIQQIIQKDRSDILAKHLKQRQLKDEKPAAPLLNCRYFVKNNQPKIKARNEQRKKHHRRTAMEIEREQAVSCL
jgi:hypothetical protein